MEGRSRGEGGEGIGRNGGGKEKEKGREMDEEMREGR